MFQRLETKISREVIYERTQDIMIEDVFLDAIFTGIIPHLFFYERKSDQGFLRFGLFEKLFELAPGVDAVKHRHFGAAVCELYNGCSHDMQAAFTRGIGHDKDFFHR